MEQNPNEVCQSTVIPAGVHLKSLGLREVQMGKYLIATGVDVGAIWRIAVGTRLDVAEYVAVQNTTKMNAPDLILHGEPSNQFVQSVMVHILEKNVKLVICQTAKL